MVTRPKWIRKYLITLDNYIGLALIDLMAIGLSAPRFSFPDFHQD